jgi:para-aminobenzoate synthetase component 1
VNLTRPVHVESVDDPWQAYRRLRRASSAHFGAFLRLDQDLAILSNSPELFLEVRGRQVASMPIKGTRPRGDTAEHDAELSEELLRSPKDRAELAMIVDLVRNDLGRVSIPGTVRCAERSLSALANVHHAAQRVEAILDPAIDLWDALVATFPPGSVTGAPKVRATHRIAQLEPSGRGVYCGAIGYASGGRSDWSVAIRTAVWHTGKARYHVGGGVVAASEPAAEWAETEAKGTALLLALAGSPISRALLL